MSIPTDSMEYPLFTEGEGEVGGDPTSTFDETFVSDFTGGNEKGTVEHIDDIAVNDNDMGVLSTAYGTDSVNPDKLIQVPKVLTTDLVDSVGISAVELIRIMDKAQKGVRVREVRPNLLTTGSFYFAASSANAILALGSDFRRMRVRLQVIANPGTPGTQNSIPDTPLLTAAAVRDTVPLNSAAMPLALNSGDQIFIQNSLDQAGNYITQFSTDGGLTWTTFGGANPLGANSGLAVATPAGWGFAARLLAPRVTHLRVQYTATVAPGAGTITFVGSQVPLQAETITGQVFVARSQSEANATNGYPIPPNGETIIEANDDIYLGSPLADIAPTLVYFLVERFGEDI